MAFTLSIVGFVVGLFAIVMIHEYGHYLVARAYGFRVLEYFLGFGPKVWSFERGEIEYGVKAIPAGGYVKIAGMNPFENDVPPGDEARAYGAKPRWQRGLVILAGPLSHFIVGGLILATVLAIWGRPTGPWRVDEVPREVAGVTSPAFAAGIRPGDVIVRVAGIAAPSSDRIGDQVTQLIGQPVPVVVERDGKERTFTLIPVADSSDGDRRGRLGVVITATGVERISLPGAFVQGYGEVGSFAADSLGQIARVFGPHGVGRMFSLLFGGATRTDTDPSSVVGISRQVGTVGEQGQWAIALTMFAYVVIFIGLINLLPLPPFDGGHLAVLLLEKIRGHVIDMRKVVPVSAVVLAFVAFFTISTLVLDIWKPLQPGP